MATFLIFFSSIALYLLFLWLSFPLGMFFSLCHQQCSSRVTSSIKKVPESPVTDFVIIKKTVLRAKSPFASSLWEQICSGEILAQRHNPLNRQDIGGSIRTEGLHQSQIP